VESAEHGLAGIDAVVRVYCYYAKRKGDHEKSRQRSLSRMNRKPTRGSVVRIHEASSGVRWLARWCLAVGREERVNLSQCGGYCENVVAGAGIMFFHSATHHSLQDKLDNKVVVDREKAHDLSAVDLRRKSLGVLGNNLVLSSPREM
jgi:hypothetical protein